MIRPAAAAGGEHRAAANRGFDILQPEDTPHELTPSLLIEAFDRAP